MQRFGESQTGKSTDAAEATVDREIFGAATQVGKAVNGFAGS